ncbi:hypothetical protein JXB01_04755 [Candidatus Micrarchaeota archaeon]|nr:hypothetical protein [Candidatus Micrarchaeota archaeon]
MIAFDPLSLFVLIFLVNFIPGALVSLSILKEKNLLFAEKLLAGFAVGLVVPPIVMFLLSFAGVLYSFNLAIAVTVLFYLAGFALVYKTKAWEPYLSFKFNLKDKNTIISLLLIVLLLVNFSIRAQSYSPVFHELDPYYYVYCAKVLITDGIGEFNDKTAWYPEFEVNHRQVPALAFLEAEWYSFYTQGGEYYNYTLALIANFYPPIAAAFAVFFLYLLLSSVYDREFALIGAGLASFVTMFILKLLAGEYEVQPYAFFSLTFFLAMYAFAVLKKDKIYEYLSWLAVFALILGSSSFVLAMSALVLFIPLQSVVEFLRKETEELKFLLQINLGVLVVSALAFILSAIYLTGNFVLPTSLAGIAFMVLFGGLLYLLQIKVTDEKKRMNYFYGIVVLGILIVFLTPLGAPIKNLAASTLGIAQYDRPLDRTIQEQAPAGTTFDSSIGFLGHSFDDGIGLLFAPFSWIANFSLSALVWVANIVLGKHLDYAWKANSVNMTILFFAYIALILSALRNYLKGERTLIFLFFGILFPTTIVGIIKAKYTIYMGFFLAGSVGLILGEFYKSIPLVYKKITKNLLTAESIKIIYYALIGIGLVLLLGQLVYNNFQVVNLVSGTMTVRFQDDPVALQPKMKTLCALTGYSDSDICAAAEDPVAYANKGIIYQYSEKLCYYSIISDPTKMTSAEQQIAQIRCGIRLTDYWIESMEWIERNTPSNARFISWWDYGHWLNFLGERNAVVRNEHRSLSMIGDVAHNFLIGTPEELKEYMTAHDSQYALFDSEIILGGNAFGGKYGALNYLACARNNQTDVKMSPGESFCEMSQMFETVYIPKTAQYTQECTISEISGKKGTTVFKIVYTPSGKSYSTTITPYYCLGEATLADGSTTPALYYLSQKYETGDLKLNKGFLLPFSSDDNFNIYQVLYTEDIVWIDNGELKSGWAEDGITKGQFYNSNLYRAYINEDLPGFELVYKTSDSAVKIFKIKG